MDAGCCIVTLRDGPEVASVTGLPVALRHEFPHRVQPLLLPAGVSADAARRDTTLSPVPAL
jgi:hypothetical protein